MSDAWGQPIAVENRAGANQRIAPEIRARASAHGYTLLHCETVTAVINPAVDRELKYHPLSIQDCDAFIRAETIKRAKAAKAAKDPCVPPQ